ncbi:MAG TPA: NAD(+)/NADH kinase [Spirochaetota bacterium]|nr:NAD(+)/NADH kinase [Spirochaetota bacterium]HQO39027.1 NAD(+)/NADH kinase [Spirochaetota bacterium]
MTSQNKKITNVSINYRPDDSLSISIIERICRLLAEKKININLPDYDIHTHPSISGYVSANNNLLSPDLVIAIGGDGTFLKTARMFIDSGAPIFGINRGKMGFLTEFSPDEYEKYLLRILDGEYMVTEKTVMKAVHSRNGAETVLFFFNDAVISKGSFSRAIEIELNIDGLFMNKYSGDGLIVATATGSTAYSLSAGGPIITPMANDVYIVNAVCPHSLSIRPVVLPVTSVTKARTLSDRTNLLLTIDGQVAIELNGSDEIRFMKSEKKMKLILHPEKNYYSILREKLNWG